MYLLIDTSTPVTRITLVEDDTVIFQESWDIGRQLATYLLGHLEEVLRSREADWHSLKGLGVYRGPGSFTGLRIGITVMNTLASSLAIPIIGGEADEWHRSVLRRLHEGDNDRIVMPLYGSEPTITTPKK